MLMFRQMTNNGGLSEVQEQTAIVISWMYAIPCPQTGR